MVLRRALLATGLLLLAAAAPARAAAPATGPVTFLALSDVHLDHDAGAVSYYHDTGRPLWAAARAKLQDLLATAHPRFVLMLGDLPAHGAHGDDLAADERTVLEDLRHVAGPQTPVFYLPGNEDGLGGNYHSFTDKNGKTPLSLDPAGNWPGLGTVDCAAAKAGQPCLLEHAVHVPDGFYAAYPLGPAAKLRLVAVNSVVFSSRYVADDGRTQAEAANAELSWLEEQLAAAESRGEAVILAMHIPPGQDAYAHKMMWADVFPLGQPTALARFVQTVRRHGGTVRLLLTGHTHMDELRLIDDGHGKIIVPGLAVPSVSPIHGNNPALKTLALDPVTFAPTGATTAASTPAAAAWGDASYTFAATYGCAAGQTVLACLQAKPRKDIEAAMNTVYTVRNPGVKEDWPSVDAAVWVQP